MNTNQPTPVALPALVLVPALVLTLAWGLLAAPAAGQGQAIEGKRLAQTGMKFLSVSVDARAAALGGALTAQEGSSVSMFYNPAGMARLGSTVDLSLGQTQWLADAVYNAGSLAFRPAGGRYGVFGVSLMAVTYGRFFETIRADNEQGFLDLGRYSPSALSAGLGYAKALTDRFSVGANAKYVRQSLGASTLRVAEGGTPVRADNEASTVAVDFGVLYKTGFRSLNFAVSARNFSREVTYAQENFELPLTFQIGVSMDMLDLTALDQNTHAFVLAVNAERPRDYAEQLKVGGEYTFMNTLALRAGYTMPTDEEGVSLGLGLRQSFSRLDFGFDYAYTRFGVFGNVQRLALHLAL